MKRQPISSLASLLGALVLLVGVAVSFFCYRAYENERVLRESRIQRNLSLLQLSANNYVEKLVRDADFIAHSPVLRMFLNSPSEKSKAATEDAFLTLGSLRYDYGQVRFLDVHGHERIRVDRDKSGVHLRQAGLQDKSGRDYVKAGLMLGQNDLLLSDIELNVEFGKIEKPYQPTIRAVTPIFVDGSRRGLVVLNGFANELLDQMRRALPAGGFELALLNETGGWIAGGDALNWQFQLDANARMSLEVPSLWASIEQREQGRFEYKSECYHYVWFRPAIHGVLSPKWLLAQKSQGRSCSARAITAIQDGLLWAFLILIITIPATIFWFRAQQRNYQYQQKLLDNQAQLSVIAQAAGHALILVDNQCQVIRMNSEAEKLLNWSEAELLGKSLYLAFPIPKDEQRPSVEGGHIWRALQSGLPQSTENKPLQTRDGRCLQVSLKVTPFETTEGRQAVVALADVTSHVALEQTLAMQAQTDELTKVLNRRALLGSLEALSKKSGHLPCVIALDIDFFKKVNDTYGHQVGDEVLIHFCRTVETVLRKGDLLGRMGGEEFLIVLGNSKMKDAMGLAERIRAAIENSPCQCKDSVSVAFTVSIGVAQHEDDESLESLLDRADQALYSAKHAGRNRVVQATAVALRANYSVELNPSE